MARFYPSNSNDNFINTIKNFIVVYLLPSFALYVVLVWILCSCGICQLSF